MVSERGSLVVNERGSLVVSETTSLVDLPTSVVLRGFSLAMSCVKVCRMTMKMAKMCIQRGHSITRGHHIVQLRFAKQSPSLHHGRERHR